MSKYTKKPEAVEAVQWDGNASTANKFIGERFGYDWDYLSQSHAIRFISRKREMLCKVGDWIIKESKGEFSVCKPEIFEQTYEPASETNTDPNVLEYLKGGVRYDEKHSDIVGDDDMVILRISDYCKITLTIDQVNKLGQFIAAAINEKIEREKNNK